MKKTLILSFCLISLNGICQINLTQGLVTYYPFSGNANDAGPNGINGTVFNASLTSDRNGNINSAYYFDGSSYINLPFNNAYNFSPQGSFSISVWVLPDQNNNWPAQAVVVKAPYNSDFTLSGWNYGTYVLSYKAMSGYAYNHVLNGTTSFVQNQCWYNIITTYENGKWHLYINGQLESTDLSQTKFIIQDGFSRMVFGKKGESNGDWYKGKMDEVRIYNRVLNPQEIDSLSFNSSVTRTIDDVTICEGTSVQLSATGANSYIWTPANGLSNANIANPVATPSVTTRYFVTGTQSEGCFSTDNVLITVNPKPIISKSADDLICEGIPKQLFSSGGVTYSWNPTTGLNNSQISDPIATLNTTTKYYIKVTNNEGCSVTDSILLTVRKKPVFLVSDKVDGCLNTNSQLNASGGDLYTWTPTSFLNNSQIPNPVSSTNQTISYSVTILDTVCMLNTTLDALVTIWPNPVIQVQKSNDIDCSNGTAELTVTGGISYNWTPLPGLSNLTGPQTSVNPTQTTVYTVAGTDIHGCTNIDSIEVLVLNDNKSTYSMPTAFTPNNDGINDCYGIKFWGVIEELDFSIYNRWGERVFHTKEAGKCWNGYHRGILQEPDVFVYMIRAKTTCGEIFRKGSFALIR